jgi:hypothetical protein
MIRKEARKKDVIHFLHWLNQDLEEFIKNSLKLRSDKMKKRIGAGGKK